MFHDPDDSDLAQDGYRRTTSSRGEARVSYNRDDDKAGIETIWAVSEDDNIRSKEDLSHYWVEEAPEDKVLLNYEVIIHDEGRNTLVVGKSGDGPYVVTYDSSDQFNLDKDRENFESFSQGLEEGDYVDIDVQGHDRDDVNTFTRYE